MRTLSVAILLATAAILMAASAAFSAVPQVIDYQGRLTDASGNPVADGPCLAKFIIYDAAEAGTALWNSGFQTISTTNGLFTYALGSNVTLPDDLFTGDTTRYLGITVGTDPEMSPRLRLVTAPYAARAAIADSLSGDILRTNMLILGSAGATGLLYVKQATTGDNAFSVASGSSGGNLSLYADNAYTHTSLQADVSGSGGYFYVTRSDLSAGFTIDGNYAGTNSPMVTIGGTSSAVFNMSTTGNSSVALPTGSIGKTEIEDEPGLSSSSSGSSVILNTSEMVDILITTITIPAAGYIYLIGRTSINLGSTTGYNTAAVQIDETSGGPSSTRSTWVGLAGYPTTSGCYFDAVTQEIYYKSAGTYTFRLEGKLATSAQGIGSSLYPSLVALYVPSAYGTVASTVSDPGDSPDAIPVTAIGPDGTELIEAGYSVDLRYYQLKAEAAEAAALEAKMELIKAQQQQQLEAAEQEME